MSIKVPQVEYISGATPQESAAMCNARMRELSRNSPTFQRDGIGFWITYYTNIGEPKRCEPKTADACCSGCPYFEEVSERTRWGRCQKYGGASVSRYKIVCDAYFMLTEGGDGFNA